MTVPAVANVELSGPDTPTGAAGQLTAFVNSVGAAVYLHALSRGVRRGDLSLQLEALSVLHALCWQVQGAPETLLDMGVLDVLAEALRGSGKVPSAVLPRRQRGREKSRERRGGKKGPRTPPESPLSTPTVNGVRHRAACEAVQLHIQLRILQLIDALVSSVREERSVRAMQRHDDLFAVVTGLASYAEAVKQEMGRAREREAELRRRQFGGSDPDSLPSSLASNDSVLHPDFSLAPLLETREKEKGPQEETGGALRPPLLMPSGVAAAGGVRGEPGERAGSDRGEEESEGSEEDIEIEGDSQGVRARLRALPSAFFQIFTPEQGKAELAASAALNSSAASLEIPVVERDKENSDGVFGGWGVVGRVRKLWSRGEKESSGGVEGGVTPEAGKGLKETSQVVDAYLGVMNVSKFNQSALTAAQNLSTSLIVPSEGEPGSSSVEQGEGKGLLSVGEFSNATRDGLLSEREREKQPLDHVFETEEMEKGKGWGIFRRVRSAFSSSSGPSSSPSETGAAVGLDNPTGGQVHALSLSSVLSSALGEAAAGVRAGVGVDREREKDRNLLAMDGLLREREELLRLVQAEMGWALGGPSSRRGGRRKRGLRILSLDGGGTRGVLTIAMLKHLVAACGGKELHEVFDFICGTSTGAIIGMLAAMGEPIAEIERKYDSWIGRIFKKDNIVWSMSRYIRMGYYDDVNWENILREILGDDRMIDLSRKGGPQLMTLSVRLGASPPDLCVWRTYNFPPWSPKGAHFPGSFKVKCREALRATTAAPLYFSPVQLENEWFVDGSIIANNPAAVALQEVTRLYPGEPVDLLVSVGTSVPHSFREIQKRERDQLERMEEEKRKAEREAPGPAAPLNGSDSKPPLELGQQERGQGENLMKGVGEREAGTRKREETDFSLSSLNTSTVSTTTTPATLSNPSPYSLEETKPTLPPFPSKPLSGSTRSRGLEYVLPSADDFADLPGFESGPMPRRGTPASSSSSRGSPSSLFDLSTSSGNALPPTGLSGVALNPLAWRESIGDSLFQDGGGGTFFEDSSRASPSPSTSSPETLLRETQYESADGYEPVSDAQVHLALLESEATAAAAAAASSPDSPPSSMTGDETEGMEGDQVQDPQRQGTWRTLLDVLDQVVQSAVDTEYIHSMLSLWFNELLPIEKSLGGSLPLSGTEGQRGGPKRPGAVYVRFNPKMEYAPIDETDPEKLDVLKKVAHRYFTDVPEVVQELKLVADIVALDSQQQSQRSHTSGGLRQRGGKSRSRKRRSQRSNSKRRRGISSWFKGWFSQPD
uniref:PNPLA domain-containing protein n=1 Tax=Chromera velia CCMP2878 TaxID=1169474 RepID=A0A0G4FG67_9ALVE|eukprot:Cvel_16671.t1-p1 / transcript=Cvel_16671.t1 / gene=Cvel_16671 / organism=Chromera_velia_CCMP2878 / gene_product=Calcium-independent phospholipase A2-gamma, putative / transcript_product=Calcium-independent phospholipase A2-gamma, putative / location=Cvel_scaffold1294:7612-13758(-) / protein_length=1283 / sequence_SO=supercontig / SO=protein_coding / is_pseudo=false